VDDTRPQVAPQCTAIVTEDGIRGRANCQFA
jgi:hypothetical protein